MRGFPDSTRLPRLRLSRHVRFTNPFTDKAREPCACARPSSRLAYRAAGRGPHRRIMRNEPNLQIRRYPRGCPRSFRSVRDLGRVRPECSFSSEVLGVRPSGWLPTWLPALIT